MSTENEELVSLLPFPMTVINLACYEALGIPITLKNGATMMPEGWLRFLKMTPEEVLSHDNKTERPSDDSHAGTHT